MPFNSFSVIALSETIHIQMQASNALPTPFLPNYRHCSGIDYNVRQIVKGMIVRFFANMKANRIPLT